MRATHKWGAAVSQQQTIQIFRPGTHVASDGRRLSFSEADLVAMAVAYDPAVHEAPIVVGHPRTDAPAYGWVEGLKIGKGGAVEATPRQVDPAFAEIVRAGRFKHVSASFYLPDSPANPAPGKLYLRHVGFLGAEPPAVKGLRPASFAEGAEGIVEFSDGWAMGTVARLLRGLREWIITTAGQEKADAILPGYDIDSVAEAAMRDTMSDLVPATAGPSSDYSEERKMDANEEAAAQAAELARREAALRDREAQFAERERVQRAAADAAWYDGLVSEGRALPAHRALALGLMGRLDGADTVSFGEAGEHTEAAALRALLGGYPKLVEFREVGGGTGGVLAADASAEDIAAAADAYEAEARAAGRAITNVEAVQAVTRRGK